MKRRELGGKSADELAVDPELSLYRRDTIRLLRRYFRMSIELGRMPTVLGREFFRAKVTSYRMQSFEDVVILVHDVERCLERLDDESQQLIAKVILQEHTHDEAAVLMGCTRRSVTRTLPLALDRLTEMLIKNGILQLNRGQAEKAEKSCQEGKLTCLRPTG